MNGVPFDVAFSLDRTTRLAFVVAIGTLKGEVYDWNERKWQSNATSPSSPAPWRG